jgi:hypothetical protein
MWDVDNLTPFACAHTWDRDREGADTWIVVVKGTFDILSDGSTSPSVVQLPVTTVPQYCGAPGQSSLKLDSDLFRVKPTTDVLVLGCARAPDDRPVDQIDVTLEVAEIRKTLRVFGDRVWVGNVGGVRRSQPRPFTAMPIVYERAYGGTAIPPDGQFHGKWDERNPVGTGYAADSERLADHVAANVEYADGRTAEPAGFGPIAPHWMPRRQWGGTFGPEWERDRKPLLPDNFDDRFYLCSPADQRPSVHLIGGEAVQVTHMTPEGLLRFRLPRVVLGFETHFSDGDVETHRQVLHSVIIEPDMHRVAMVWQTSLRCHSRVLQLESTQVYEKQVLSASVRG